MTKEERIKTRAYLTAYSYLIQVLYARFWSILPEDKAKALQGDILQTAHTLPSQIDNEEDQTVRELALETIDNLLNQASTEADLLRKLAQDEIRQ